MPVTAKLSKLFYDRLGEQIANELVDWFNAVDAAYRADLRELNELNFARFDAKVEQRLAELHAKLDSKIDRIAAQLEGKLDRSVAEHAFAQLDSRIDRTSSDMRAQLAEQRADLLKWMFIFWAGTVIPLGGLIVAVLRP